jgi:hypothetical protein
MLGHSSVDVTERYAHLATDVLSDAAHETSAIPAAALALLPFSLSGTDPGTDRAVNNEKSRDIYRERETGFEPATSTLASIEETIARQILSPLGSPSVPDLDMVSRIRDRIRRRPSRSRAVGRHLTAALTGALIANEPATLTALAALGRSLGLEVA